MPQEDDDHQLVPDIKMCLKYADINQQSQRHEFRTKSRRRRSEKNLVTITLFHLHYY